MPRTRKYEKLFIYTIHGPVKGVATHFSGRLLAEWEDSGTTLLFFEEPMENEVRAFISVNCPGAEFLSETVMNYDEWEAGHGVETTRAGGFLICPTWDVQEPRGGEKRILLDPGVAFGSGFHTTTRHCLEAMAEVFRDDPPSRVLDLGCGTGILSIAAVMLGAEKVVAVDYTSMATDRAHECVELNGVSDRIEIVCGDALDNLHHPAELLVSNMYIQVIAKLIERHEYTGRKWLLVSGIHSAEQDLITVELLEHTGREIVKTYEGESWYTYLTRLKE